MYSSSEYSSELLRNVLRYFAWAMISMGIYTLLSGGVNIVSSIMVVAMGYQWLCAAASRGSLQTHLNELALLSDKDCRGCCRNCCSGMCRGTFDNIRGLAVAAITFGFLEHWVGRLLTLATTTATIATTTMFRIPVYLAATLVQTNTARSLTILHFSTSPTPSRVFLMAIHTAM